MEWKIKALIQNIIARLPDDIGNKTYYVIQKKFGGLKGDHDFSIKSLQDSKIIWESIIQNSCIPEEKIFFEVGTGRIPELPIFLWIMGAKEIITYDLNKLAKEELVKNFIKKIIENESVVRDILGNFIKEERFKDLKKINEKEINLSKILDTCSIKYFAPADASKTNISNSFIDFYISYNVLEHVPYLSIVSIINEGLKILKTDGLMIHYIDYSDHFSHDDKKISSINFLKYSQNVWDIIANNRFMFMNRLRNDDFIKLFKSNKLKILDNTTFSDINISEEIRCGKITINKQFKNKSAKVLSIVNAWFVMKKEN